MTKLVLVVALVGATALSGCATPLNSAQKREMQFFNQKGYTIEEKNPAAAAGLGLLPGFGSFYVREYGLGIVNLLLWPASVLWDPVSGYDGAQVINYSATREAIHRKMKKEIKALDEALMQEQITRDQYLLKKKAIEEEYVYDA